MNKKQKDYLKMYIASFLGFSLIGVSLLLFKPYALIVILSLVCIAIIWAIYDEYKKLGE